MRKGGIAHSICEPVCVQLPTYANSRALPNAHIWPSHAASAAIDWYLLLTRPTAAIRQSRTCCCGLLLEQTDQRMDTVWFHRPCSAYYVPSVLWRCWLGGRKGTWPVKNWVVGCWHGYLSGARRKLAWPSWCHCHSLSLASVKSRLVLPFWYWLTHVVLDKGPLNVCVCVCVHACVHVLMQKVVTLNTCCDNRHSSCHISQPVFFRATDDNLQLALFGASNVWMNATDLLSDEKVLQFTS